jgi:tRNA (Thr-GGU) A37 N-methylase
MEFTIRSVATVRATRVALDDDEWDAIESSIELNSDVPSESLRGLETFSHLQVVFMADRASDVPPERWIRRPRGREEWPEVGVFAQRNKDRPNRLLTSIAEILDVRERSVSLKGLDAVDGTPVVDMKPVFRWSGPRGGLTAPRWSDELGDGYF